MEVTIKLSLDDEKAIQDRATASGQDVASYLYRLIHRHLKVPVALAEVLAPIRHEYAESGMSEDDLDTLVEVAREEVWREKHGPLEPMPDLSGLDERRADAS